MERSAGVAVYAAIQRDLRARQRRVVGDAERSQRVGGVAGMVGHRCHTVAAHAGDDFDWAAFVAGHLRWQDLAEECHGYWDRLVAQ